MSVVIKTPEKQDHCWTTCCFPVVHRSVEEAVNMGLECLLQHFHSPGTCAKIPFVEFSLAFIIPESQYQTNHSPRFTVPGSISQASRQIGGSGWSIHSVSSLHITIQDRQRLKEPSGLKKELLKLNCPASRIQTQSQAARIIIAPTHPLLRISAKARHKPSLWWTLEFVIHNLTFHTVKIT